MPWFPPCWRALPLPTLSEFTVDSGGNINLATPVQSTPIFLGYGAEGQTQLPLMDSIAGENGAGRLGGLVFLPGSTGGRGNAISSSALPIRQARRPPRNRWFAST